jgi:CheY-like chemotaxis protein
VILDLIMPIVNGWEVLDAIRGDPWLQVPVIVVSAFGNSKPDGVAAYLCKPFDMVDLLDAVRGARCESHREGNRCLACREAPNYGADRRE